MREDPRVHVAASALRAQYELASAIARLADAAYDSAERVRPRDKARARALARANGALARLMIAVESGDGAPTATQLAAFHRQAATLTAIRMGARLDGTPR